MSQPMIISFKNGLTQEMFIDIKNISDKYWPKRAQDWPDSTKIKMSFGLNGGEGSFFPGMNVFSAFPDGYAREFIAFCGIMLASKYEDVHFSSGCSSNILITAFSNNFRCDMKNFHSQLSYPLCRDRITFTSCEDMNISTWLKLEEMGITSTGTDILERKNIGYDPVCILSFVEDTILYHTLPSCHGGEFFTFRFDMPSSDKNYTTVICEIQEKDFHSAVKRLCSFEEVRSYFSPKAKTEVPEAFTEEVPLSKLANLLKEEPLSLHKTYHDERDYIKDLISGKTLIKNSYQPVFDNVFYNEPDTFSGVKNWFLPESLISSHAFAPQRYVWWIDGQEMTETEEFKP